MPGDSRPETWQHIHEVQTLLLRVCAELTYRALEHDQSKLSDPERSVFDEFTPLLAGASYGSAEYKACLAGMAEALRHHYAVNDHHPEHYPDGIAAMGLLQVLELLCDWKAATMRHADGDLDRSISQNAERFGYGPEFERLLRNTASELGWL